MDKNKYESDKNKSVSRTRKILPFVKEHLTEELEGKKSLFLLGGSLIEVDQIHSPLGFYPNNIYGIERDSNEFRRAHQLNLQRSGNKIRIFEGEFSDFLKKEHGPFSFVNFDSNTNYGSNIINSLDKLLSDSGSKLEDNSVLIVAMQAKREHEKYFKRLNLLGLISESLKEREYLLISELLKGTPNEVKEPLLASRINRARKYVGMANQIVESVIDDPNNGERISNDYNELLRTAIYEEVRLRIKYSKLMEINEDELYKEATVKEKKILDAINGKLDTTTCNNLGITEVEDFRDPLKFGIYFNSLPHLFHRIRRDTVTSLENFSAGSQSLNVSAYEYFKYNNNKGTPMIVSMFSLKREPNSEIFSDELSKSLDEIIKNVNNAKDSRYLALRLAVRQSMGNVKDDITLLDLLKAIPIIETVSRGEIYLPHLYSAGEALKNKLEHLLENNDSFLEETGIDRTETLAKYISEVNKTITKRNQTMLPELTESELLITKSPLTHYESAIITQLIRRGFGLNEIYQIRTFQRFEREQFFKIFRDCNLLEEGTIEVILGESVPKLKHLGTLKDRELTDAEKAEILNLAADKRTLDQVKFLFTGRGLHPTQVTGLWCQYHIQMKLGNDLTEKYPYFK